VPVSIGDEVLTRLLRYLLRMPVEGLEYVINRTFPVKELSHVDASGVQAKAITRIGVKENRPVDVGDNVVELLLRDR
jgi:hypothetical protein